MTRSKTWRSGQRLSLLGLRTGRGGELELEGPWTTCKWSISLLKCLHADMSTPRMKSNYSLNKKKKLLTSCWRLKTVMEEKQYFTAAREREREVFYEVDCWIFYKCLTMRHHVFKCRGREINLNPTGKTGQRIPTDPPLHDQSGQDVDEWSTQETHMAWPLGLPVSAGSDYLPL